MNSKQVAQLDFDGYFMYLTDADESPLESGIFHLPAGCIEEIPPKPDPNKKLRWVNSKWIQEDNEDFLIKYNNYIMSSNARKYLNDTDWYVIRQMETGTLIPDEIKNERINARLKIINNN